LAVMSDDLNGVPDNQLLNRAARLNAELRRGRRLVKEGEGIIRATIGEFVAHQNELQSRASQRLEQETDKLETV